MKPNQLVAPCCSQCWHTAANPCRNLIACISEGPLCHKDDKCRALRADRLSTARRGGEGDLLFIGTGTCGLANGASRIMRRIQSFLAANRIVATLIEVGCVGYCQREVFMDLLSGSAPRLSYCDITPDNITELLEEIYVKRNLKNRFLLGRWDDADGSFSEVPLLKDTPFFKRQSKVVLENCGRIDPASLDAALAMGAFRAAARAIQTMTPAEVCDTVLESGLRGRGGAGFLTGQKWRVAHDTVSAEKYVICNADEGDPGAFMDRAVLEGDPFRVLEGLIIAAYAVGASKGYIYCRAEYPLAIDRLRSAISQCLEAGLLGHNILDSLFSFDCDHQAGRGRLCLRRRDGHPRQYRRGPGDAQAEAAFPGSQRPPRETDGPEQCRDPGQRSPDHRKGNPLVQGALRRPQRRNEGLRPERLDPQHGTRGSAHRHPLEGDHLRYRRRGIARTPDQGRSDGRTQRRLHSRRRRWVFPWIMHRFSNSGR